MPIPTYNLRSRQPTLRVPNVPQHNGSVIREIANLSSQVFTFSIQEMERANKAEVLRKSAELQTKMLERQLANQKVTGQAVLANPDAQGPFESPFTNPTLSLFDRTKDGLNAERDAFIDEGSNEAVKEQLAMVYDQASLQLLQNTANWQAGQQHNFYEQAADEASSASKAQFLAQPLITAEDVEALAANNHTIYSNDAEKAERAISAALIEGVRAQARKSTKVTADWLTKNEDLIDRVAPGTYTALQDQVRQEESFQVQQKQIQINTYKQKQKLAQDASARRATKLTNDALLGIEGSVSPMEAARQIAHDPTIKPELQRTLVNALRTSMREVPRTDYTALGRLNSDAMLGQLNQEALNNAVINQQISVSQAHSLASFNEQAKGRLEETARVNLKGAINYIGSMFKTDSPLGPLFEGTLSKQQYNMAVNKLREEYYALEPAQRHTLFETEDIEAPDGSTYTYMPKVDQIYKWAKSLPLSTAQKMIGDNTSILFNPKAQDTMEEKFKAMDKILEGK